MRNSARVTLCVKTSGEKSLSASFSASEVISWNTRITVQWCKGSLEYDFLCERVILTERCPPCMSSHSKLNIISSTDWHRKEGTRKDESGEDRQKHWWWAKERKQLVSSLKWLICPLTNYYLFHLTLNLPGCSHSVFPLHFFPVL